MPNPQKWTGRFGWKAESYSLATQVARALSLDMGLGTSLFPSAFGDCTASQPDCMQLPSGNSPLPDDPEVSDTILDLLLTYITSLAPAQSEQEAAAQPGGSQESNSTPVDRSPNTYAEHISSDKTSTRTGAEIFNSVGCSACHSLSLPAGDQTIHPFTDLLLHDMGRGLSVENAQYTSGSEWRTAPLWGLSSVSTYLHDGRATTLAEAILWHEGEATAAVQAYDKLSRTEREVLHSWLHRL